MKLVQESDYMPPVSFESSKLEYKEQASIVEDLRKRLEAAQEKEKDILAAKAKLNQLRELKKLRIAEAEIDEKYPDTDLLDCDINHYESLLADETASAMVTILQGRLVKAQAKLVELKAQAVECAIQELCAEYSNRHKEVIKLTEKLGLALIEMHKLDSAAHTLNSKLAEKQMKPSMSDLSHRYSIGNGRQFELEKWCFAIRGEAGGFPIDPTEILNKYSF